jgi:septum formation protein
MPASDRLLLASASPRRAELLTAAGFSFDVDPVDVDESRLPGEPAAVYVERLARLKAAAGVGRHAGRVVVAADTAVVLGEDVLGKPRDTRDAVNMLGRLSGGAHEVLTGLAVASRGHTHAHVERTQVWFRELSRREIDWYVASGEPMGKAGAYAIQGLAARFIPRIDGSYSNVVGLPVSALVDLLAAVDSTWSGAVS